MTETKVQIEKELLRSCFFTFMLPTELDAALTEFMHRRALSTGLKISKARILREALRKYLGEQNADA